MLDERLSRTVRTQCVDANSAPPACAGAKHASAAQYSQRARRTADWSLYVSLDE